MEGLFELTDHLFLCCVTSTKLGCEQFMSRLLGGADSVLIKERLNAGQKQREGQSARIRVCLLRVSRCRLGNGHFTGFKKTPEVTGVFIRGAKVVKEGKME